jgi:organic radical activating enzyme
LIPKEGGFDYDTNTVIEHIYKYNDFYNSVVMLGGEPCLQMTALTHLIDNINLPIVLYTGWYYSDIPKYIRNSVDIIIDGPYIEKLRTENFPISTNQNIYVNGKLDNSDFRKTPYAKI